MCTRLVFLHIWSEAQTVVYRKVCNRQMQTYGFFWNAMYRPELVDGNQASPQGVRIIRNIQQLVPDMNPIDMHWDCFRIVLVLDWLSPTIRPRCGQFNVIIVCCRLLCTVPCCLLDWLRAACFPIQTIVAIS